MYTVAAVGDEFELNCTAEGDDPIAYAWTGPGNTLRQGAFWLVKADSPAQGGLYMCRATNTRITDHALASSVATAVVTVEMSKTRECGCFHTMYFVVRPLTRKPSNLILSQCFLSQLGFYRSKCLMLLFLRVFLFLFRSYRLLMIRHTGKCKLQAYCPKSSCNQFLKLDVFGLFALLKLISSSFVYLFLIQTLLCPHLPLRSPCRGRFTHLARKPTATLKKKATLLLLDLQSSSLAEVPAGNLVCSTPGTASFQRDSM